MNTGASTFGSARFLSTAVVARAFGVHRETVRRWCDEGECKGAIRTRASGAAHWRIPVGWVRQRGAGK